MDDLVLLFLIGIPILSILFGYLLWKSAMDNYGYNIYGVGVLIRLAIAILSCFYDPTLGLWLFIIFSIWNLLITWKNTSFIIAFFSILFQPIALYFAFVALNRLAKAINN
ncbi:MAG: hypothetical protein GW771_14505 [Flavobacteriia bacterium]|nr:hypothetical protein [Flavobacteriia bacterium]PIV96824.1 MAG: hypothetical protein COW43_06685 [Flavobacteriaceae bacterium CG17_big_fil_post_rev_8_21_14_2_50_31_13]